ncbi:MAG: anti-sigma factor [Brucellaceae bacterium]|nr:anti-sigma factor [Brucellaceae bacterium]
MANDRPNDISEDELHAYVDGQLPAERRASVEKWLAAHPDAAAEIREWQRQNEEIRKLFPLETARPEDRRYVADRPRGMPRRAAYAAAAVLLFLAGGIAGGIATYQTLRSGIATELASIQDASRQNFLIYASEVRHPIEVGADEQAHLVAWLGKRVGTVIVTPDLSEQGFRLIGGRLVPFDGQPAALLMYEDETGERLTILVGRNTSGRESGFRFNTAEEVQTFSWSDDMAGYALSGRITRDRLEAVSEAAYRQL